MWRAAEGSVRPEEATVGKSTVYIRKNIHTETRNSGEEETEVWVWDEEQVPLEQWETWQKATGNAQEIADIEDALCELSKEE